MRYPFAGSYEITQGYGTPAAATAQFYSFHTGIDFGLPLGTPVLSVCDGMVQQIGQDDEGWGLYVIVRPTGSVEGRLYAHLSEITVQQNQDVAEGDQLGFSGDTGQSTGAHLHFECRSQWENANTHYEPVFDYVQAVDSTAAAVTPFVPEELPTDLTKAMIAAPAGANLRDDELNYMGLIMPGFSVELTGNVREDDDIPRREVLIRGWLAEHDGSDQILKGVS